MNWLEPIQLMPAATGGAWTMWLAGAAMLISVAMLAAASFMVLRNHRLRLRLERLERELLVFTEASTRVAQTLEEVLLGRMPSRQSIQTSRRYLLLQARERLHRGESLQGIARGLGLSHDETRLLAHAQIHKPQRNEGTARVKMPPSSTTPNSAATASHVVEVEFPDDINHAA